VIGFSVEKRIGQTHKNRPIKSVMCHLTKSESVANEKTPVGMLAHPYSTVLTVTDYVAC